MSDTTVSITCSIHGKSYATFVCQHIANSSGQGFFYGDEDDLRPDALCEQCDQLLSAHNGEWTEEVVNFADIKLLCAKCYDLVRLKNEVPHKRIKPKSLPTLEDDGWELDSAVRQNRLHPATFKIPSKSEIKRLKIGDYAKLLFLFGVVNEAGQEEMACERMWVNIQQIANGSFVGRLDNVPTLSQAVKAEDKIEFHWQHIAAILPQEQSPAAKARMTNYQKGNSKKPFLH